MTARKATSETFDQAISAISSCALDEAGIREQQFRYARLAQGVRALERRPDELLVTFAEDFDRVTLEKALEVERTCCPFFEFDFDESGRALRITVRNAEQLPALDAIAYALGAAPDELQ
jgi:hypothetical protein